MVNYRYFSSPFPQQGPIVQAPSVPLQGGPDASLSGEVLPGLGPQSGPFSGQAVDEYYRALLERERGLREQADALAGAQRTLGQVKYEEPERARVDPKTKAWVVGLSALSALAGNRRAGEHAQQILGARKASLDERYADELKRSQTDYDNRLRAAVADVEAGRTLSAAEKDAYERAFGQLSFAGQRQGQLFGQSAQERGLWLDERQVALAEKKWAEESKPAWQRDYEALRSQFKDLPEAQVRGMALARLLEGYDLNRYNAELRPILLSKAQGELGLDQKRAAQMDLDLRIGLKNLEWFDRETQARINSAIASAYAAQSAAARGNAMHPYEVWQVQYQGYYDSSVRPLLLQMDAEFDPAKKADLARQVGQALSRAPQPGGLGPGQYGPPGPVRPFDPFDPGTGLQGPVNQAGR